MSLTTSLSKNKEPIYFHREHKNDVTVKVTQNSWIEQGKRFALVSLPFVSLYKPISSHLALGLGALRTVSSVSQLLHAINEGERKDISYQFLQTTIAAVSLAGTIFAHPIGMVITTGQDLIIEVSKLKNHLDERNYQKAIESCTKIINESLYLSLLIYGGIELAVASLAVQVVLGIYEMQKEFGHGNSLEGCGHLAMAIIRTWQLNNLLRLLQMKWQIERSHQKVGVLWACCITS